MGFTWPREDFLAMPMLQASWALPRTTNLVPVGERRSCVGKSTSELSLHFAGKVKKKGIKLINSELSVRTGSFLLLHLDFFCKEFLRKVVEFQACLSPGKPYSSKSTSFSSQDVHEGQYLNIFW